MNPAPTSSVAQEHPNKWYRLPLSDGQREELNSAVHAYFQNAELSAKGMGIEETAAILAVLFVCKYPDGTQVALADGDFSVCKDGEVPHPLLLSKGHRDSTGPMGDNASDMDWYDESNSQSSDTGKT